MESFYFSVGISGQKRVYYGVVAGNATPFYGRKGGRINGFYYRTAGDSYSPKLAEFSVYYKTWSNVLTVRTVAAEYLVAMKLRSGRQYKSDLSDVIGILYEHEKRGTPISMEQIRRAVSDLYSVWDALPEASQAFIGNVMRSGQLAQLYAQTAAGEKETKELLLQFEQDYPGVTKESNVDAIARTLQKKTNRASVPAQLREIQQAKEDTPSLAGERPKDDRER